MAHDNTGPIVNGEQFAPGYTPEAAAYEQSTRTVTISPDYDRLREWMLRVWADPKQAAFRDAVRAAPSTLAWLNPPAAPEPRCPGHGRDHNQPNHYAAAAWYCCSTCHWTPALYPDCDSL